MSKYVDARTIFLYQLWQQVAAGPLCATQYRILTCLYILGNVVKKTIFYMMIVIFVIIVINHL